MDYEKAVVEFLSSKENLPFALEIAEKIESVKDKIQVEFWELVTKKLEEQMAGSPFAENWKVKSDKEESFLNNHVGVAIIPAEAECISLTVKIKQVSSVCEIEKGIRWSSEFQDEITIDKLVKFKKEYELQGFKTTPWWLLHKGTGYKIRTDDFLIRLAHDLEGVTSQIADLVWEFFSENEEEIRHINKLIEENGGKP